MTRRRPKLEAKGREQVKVKKKRAPARCEHGDPCPKCGAKVCRHCRSSETFCQEPPPPIPCVRCGGDLRAATCTEIKFHSFPRGATDHAHCPKCLVYYCIAVGGTGLLEREVPRGGTRIRCQATKRDGKRCKRSYATLGRKNIQFCSQHGGSTSHMVEHGRFMNSLRKAAQATEETKT